MPPLNDSKQDGLAEIQKTKNNFCRSRNMLFKHHQTSRILTSYDAIISHNNKKITKGSTSFLNFLQERPTKENRQHAAKEAVAACLVNFLTRTDVEYAILYEEAHHTPERRIFHPPKTHPGQKNRSL